MNQQYTVNSKNSTAVKRSFDETQQILQSFPDLIPDDGYTGFYVNKLNEIGLGRFTELANKARAGSESPARLFAWMLKNHRIVR